MIRRGSLSTLHRPARFPQDASCVREKEFNGALPRPAARTATAEPARRWFATRETAGRVPQSATLPKALGAGAWPTRCSRLDVDWGRATRSSDCTGTRSADVEVWAGDRHQDAGGLAQPARQFEGRWQTRCRWLGQPQHRRCTTTATRIRRPRAARCGRFHDSVQRHGNDILVSARPSAARAASRVL